MSLNFIITSVLIFVLLGCKAGVPKIKELKSLSAKINDTTKPSLTITQKSNQADPINSAPISFEIVFSEEIEIGSFTSSDISNFGSSIVSTWSIIDSGDHIHFTVQATSVLNDGTVQPMISAGNVADLAGNLNTQSLSGNDNQVTYDATPPVISFTTPAENSTTSSIFLTISGSCEANLRGDFGGTGLGSAAYTTCNTGSFAHGITLNTGYGSKNISLSQTDAAGNTSSINRNFILISQFLWTGASDNSWSNTSNWSGGSVPGTSDVATFSSSCTNCKVSIGSNVSINGIFMLSDYAGTITLNGNNLTLAGDLTISTGATIKKNCGTLSYSTLTNNGNIINGNGVTLSVSSPSVSENSSLTFIATLSAASCDDVTFNYTTANGTAIAGTDYTALSGSATITSGSTSTAIIISPIDDSDYETNEELSLIISNATFESISNSTGTGTISDNDVQPAVQWSVSTASSNESSGTVSVNLVLDHASYQTISVPFVISGSATDGTDFTVTASPIVFNPGETTKSVSINITDDVSSETAETVVLTLAAPTNASLGGVNNYTHTINDNDAAAPVVTNISSSTADGTYGNGSSISIQVTFDMLVTVTGSPILNLNASYPTTSLANYSSGSGSSVLTFNYTVAPGQNTNDLDTTSLVLNGGTINSALAVPASLTIPTGANISSLKSNKALIINSPLLSTVSPVYATNGQKWNDYIKNNNGGTNPFNQPDTACDGTETGYYNACIHAGEKIKFVLSGFISCTGLTFSDSLNAFDWKCDDNAGAGPLTFYSLGLKEGKGLADLINPTSWKSNTFTVNDGTFNIGASSNTVWWTNSVVSAGSPPCAAALSVASNIYTVSTTQEVSGAGPGCSIEADKIGFVVLPGARLYYNGTSMGANCNLSGEQAASLYCTLYTGSQKFLWIEGDISGGHTSGIQETDYALLAAKTIFSRFNNLRISDAGQTGEAGIYLLHVSSSPSRSNLFTNIQSTFNGGSGLSLAISSYNIFSKIYLNNNGSGADYGLKLSGASNENIFSEMVLNSNYGYGANIGSTNNTFTNITSSNNGSTGGNFGFNMTVGSNTINQLLTLNNTSYGLKMSGPTAANKLSQIVSLNNGVGMIQDSGTSSTYHHNLIVGSTPACNITGSTGLTTGATCANSSSATVFNSTAYSITNIFSGGGKVSSNDTQNSQDTSGISSVIYSLITDFFNFNSPFRSWGRDGSAFPNTDHRGKCDAGNCRIWDFSLSLASSLFINKSGDFSTAEPFVGGSACPAAVNGNSGGKILTDSLTAANTFLVNALEIINDSKGDDDGLCESNEACVYSPNFGAYQGHGALSNQTCTYTGDTVTGVEMYGRTSNGF